MTSHFDNLMGLYSDTFHHQKFPAAVTKLILEEAVKELDKVDPNKTTWEKWSSSKTIYAVVYREGKASLEEAQANFINHCHTVLDHDGGHHLRCFSMDFLALMDFIKNTRRRGLEETDSKYWTPIGLGARKWKKIKTKYQQIVDALKEHAAEIEIDPTLW